MANYQDRLIFILTNFKITLLQYVSYSLLQRYKAQGSKVVHLLFPNYECLID